MLRETRRTHRRLLGTLLSVILWTLFSSSLTPTLSRADVLRVPEDFQTMGAAIAYARDGDEVHVAPSETAYSGPGNRELNFHGKAVRLVGTAGPGRTWIDASDSNDSVFVFESGESRASVISGFTIVNGVEYRGGAVRIENGSSPTIMNCRFERNTATYGGAVACRGGSRPLIERCVFRRNSVEKYGGAIEVSNGSHAEISDCEFYENFTRRAGGALSSRESAVTIESSRFIGNYALSRGGAISFEGRIPNRTSLIANTVFAGNFSCVRGGGIHSINSNPDIVHTTFFKNQHRAVEWTGTDKPRVANSIAWMNEPAGLMNGDLTLPNLVDVDPHFVEEGEFRHDRETIMGGEEIRVARSIIRVGDYRLTSRSTEAIDAADPSFVTYRAHEGNGRSCDPDGLPDFGAYEYCAPRFKRGDVNVDNEVGVADAVFVLDVLFHGDRRIGCLDAADTNDDGWVNLSDPVALLNHLYGGGSEPRAPYSECGHDPTSDELDCEAYASCSAGGMEM